VATVKTRLRRGLGQLREALDKRHGGDRDTWMSAVTALAAPTGGGVGIGAVVIGGMTVGTMTRVRTIKTPARSVTLAWLESRFELLG
jgi:hypothetical protein